MSKPRPATFAQAYRLNTLHCFKLVEPGEGEMVDWHQADKVLSDAAAPAFGHPRSPQPDTPATRTETEQRMADVRNDIGTALEGKLSAEQLEKLMDEVLAITKSVSAEFTCRHCRKKTMNRVTVPDAKAVTSALVELANQAWGRPQQESEGVQPITFVRKIVYSGTSGTTRHPAPLWTRDAFCSAAPAAVVRTTAAGAAEQKASRVHKERDASVVPLPAIDDLSKEGDGLYTLALLLRAAPRLVRKLDESRGHGLRVWNRDAIDRLLRQCRHANSAGTLA